MKSKHFKLVALTCICLMASLFSAAQKHADLQFSVVYPQNNAIIPYGDTIPIKVSVKNLGPDTLFLNVDTIYYGITVFPNFTLYNYANIPPLDTAIFTVLYAYSTENKDVVDTICTYLLPTATTYVDSNSENDTACVSFTLKGRNSTGVSNLSIHKNGLILFPNPADNSVNIHFETPQTTQIIGIKIKDILGRTVIQEDQTLSANSKNFDLDVSTLKQGFYFIEIMSGQRSWLKKLSIIR